MKWENPMKDKISYTSGRLVGAIALSYPPPPPPGGGGGGGGYESAIAPTC